MPSFAWMYFEMFLRKWTEKKIKHSSCSECKLRWEWQLPVAFTFALYCLWEYISLPSLFYPLVFLPTTTTKLEDWDQFMFLISLILKFICRREGNTESFFQQLCGTTVFCVSDSTGLGTQVPRHKVLRLNATSLPTLQMTSPYFQQTRWDTVRGKNIAYTYGF